MPNDPDTGMAMCLHLYCKLVPWELVCSWTDQDRSKLSRVSRQTIEGIPLPRACIDPTLEPNGLPILSIEPTDPNRTNMSHRSSAEEIKVRSIFLRAFESLVSAEPHAAWIKNVGYLYSPEQFEEEGYYCYDVLCFSKVCSFVCVCVYWHHTHFATVYADAFHQIRRPSAVLEVCRCQHGSIWCQACGSV
jgi:hypothetical protein